jgi:peroxiredoxin Q/BCP
MTDPKHGRYSMTKKTMTLALAVLLGLFTPMAASAMWLGDKAPLFTAESTTGEVKMEDFLGKKYVVLAFYFFVNTPA